MLDDPRTNTRHRALYIYIHSINSHIYASALTAACALAVYCSWCLLQIAALHSSNRSSRD